jgi:hypothetical protein
MESEMLDVLRGVQSQCAMICERVRAIEGALEVLASESRANKALLGELVLCQQMPAPKSSCGPQDLARAAQIALVDREFPSEFIQRVVSFNIPLVIFTEFETARLAQDFRAREFAFLIVHVLLFAVQSSERKTAKSSSEGVIHERMRAQILYNLFFNFQKRVEREQSAQASLSESRSSVEANLYDSIGYASQDVVSQRPSPAHPQAIWLRPGFFKKHHFENPARESEGPASSGARAKKKRKTAEGSALQRDEIAAAVIKEVKEKVTQFLNKSRHAARTKFAEDLGFLLRKDARDLSLAAETGDDDDDNDVDELEAIADVPDARTGTADGATESNAAENESMYLRLVELGRRMEMQYLATYSVTVQDRAGELEEKTITRAVDLVEVSLNFCISFFQSHDRHHFLRSSKHSLRVMFFMSLAFREMVRRAFPQCCRALAAAVSSSPASDILNTLLPGTDYYKEKILPRVSTMSLQTYTRLNKVRSGPDVARDDDEGENIVEDAFMGLVELS